MWDMLVKLYELPDIRPVLDSMTAQGIDIRRALPPEKHLVTAWIARHFGRYWVSETENAYANRPPSCFIATHEGRCVGFACYDATAKAFFGPTGVDETYRGRGIGKALLLACLHDMWANGYVYAVIGDPGPSEFYAKTVGATPIPGSSPGIYRGMLRDEGEDEGEDE